MLCRMYNLRLYEYSFLLDTLSVPLLCTKQKLRKITYDLSSWHLLGQKSGYLETRTSYLNSLCYKLCSIGKGFGMLYAMMFL